MCHDNSATESVLSCISIKVSQISFAFSRRLILLNSSGHNPLKRISQAWALYCSIFNSSAVASQFQFSPIKEFTLQANTHNSPNGGVMSKNMHFHLMLPTSKISTIKVRTSTVVISLARRHTLLGCETKAMITKSYWKSKQMETKALILLVGSKVCLEGVIRLLDQIKIYHFPNFSCGHILAISTSQAINLHMQF